MIAMRIKNMGPAQELPKETDPYESAIFAAELGEAPTIDLHELMKDEAISQLDQFLNHEFVDGTEVIKIIHGRGTGKLRDVIHAYLGDQELVAKFRDAETQNQKGGVTFAALYSKDRTSESRLKEV
jgi:dsDNA-specific endonuclease/ATPase MutS2